MYTETHAPAWAAARPRSAHSNGRGGGGGGGGGVLTRAYPGATHAAVPSVATDGLGRPLMRRVPETHSAAPTHSRRRPREPSPRANRGAALPAEAACPFFSRAWVAFSRPCRRARPSSAPAQPSDDAYARSVRSPGAAGAARGLEARRSTLSPLAVRQALPRRVGDPTGHFDLVASPPGRRPPSRL